MPVPILSIQVEVNIFFALSYPIMLMPSKGVPIIVPENLPVTYLPPMEELCTFVALLFIGGASAVIQLLTSPSQVPFIFSSHLCISPGVAYSIQALFMAAVSGGVAGVASLAVGSVIFAVSVFVASV